MTGKIKEQGSEKTRRDNKTLIRGISNSSSQTGGQGKRMGVHIVRGQTIKAANQTLGLKNLTSATDKRQCDLEEVRAA